MGTLVNSNSAIKKFLSEEDKQYIYMNKKLTMKVPILIAARNEELAIKNTLIFLVDSLINYKNGLKEKCKKINNDLFFKKLENLEFNILICDNNSNDKTIENIYEFKIQHKKLIDDYKINIFILKESNPGKLNALKTLLKYLEMSFLNSYDHIIFTDAEIEWGTNVYSELIDFKIKNSNVKLIGTKIIPKNKKLGFWGKLELLPYYGYGETLPNGHGMFFKFISGMCYLADRSVLHILKNEVPSIIGNEDVALSAIIGKNNIHILSNACIYYYVTNNIKQFFIIRGRHIRDLYRLERWLKQWYINKFSKKYSYQTNNKKKQIKFIKKCVKKRFYDISENRLLKFILIFYSSSEKLNFSLNGLIKWIKNIRAFKLGLYFIFILTPLGLFWYIIIKIISFLQSYYIKNEGWQTIRILENHNDEK